jgi:multidrug efflux pump subunit AcrA (membrane-fusion protein)
MSELATPLPCRRPELVIRPLGERGPYVVKEPGSGAYYHLGDEEHFLLGQLDGQQDGEAIRAAFAEQFGQPLTEEELQEFLEMAGQRGLLQEDGQEDQKTRRQGDRETGRQQDDLGDAMTPGGRAPFGLRLLYWRKSFFDPDRFFAWLAPKIWFFWTPAFVVFSAGCIVLATAILWANRQGLATSFLSALRWETAILAWLVLLGVTTCHEFAHGLTCKRHGGEVHEVGFLLIFFMPCFYCNVSDAWLFREKSKRLWVTFAGAYFELFLWALAVFVWRVTAPDSLVNYLAFLVLAACGLQTLFNFNPLLKLDGYYLLSDWLEVPNLHQRSGQYVKGQIRRLLWGAPRPEPEPRARCLLLYGLVSWLYSLTFLILSLVVLSHFLGGRLGLIGVAAVALLGLLSLRGLFHGFTAGEVRNMILLRRKRTVLWVAFLGGVPAALFLIPMQDRAGGAFCLRPVSRAEVRAPVAGFLREVSGDEGDRVAPGAVLARLEIPDLACRLAQKRAEVREGQARLRLLEAGPRYEEIIEQRRRVERAREWCDLAEQDLGKARQALGAELARLDKQIAQYQAEVKAAQPAFARARELRGQRAFAPEQAEEAERKFLVAQSQLAQAESQKRHRQALGTREAIAGLDAEAELARRQKDLADAQATLNLLEAGSRPEEIEAERARLARLHEEARYLVGLEAKLLVRSPVGGIITTSRLKERIGQYLREGELICQVEEPAALEAEIAVPEQEVARVQPGQVVMLKVRALPFETLTAHVDRLAPAAARGEVQGTVTVYCRLAEPGSLGPPADEARLRPGMTGHARIYTARRAVGGVLLDRVLRFVRTEFWW